MFCECVAPSCWPPPPGVRMTSGTLACAAEHAVDLRRVVDDLVQGQQREVDRHDLDDRAQAEHGRADRGAGEALLGDRRVADPLGAELAEQARGDLVGALEDADLLAHEEDAVVAQHLLAQRVVQRLAVGLDVMGSLP